MRYLELLTEQQLDELRMNPSSLRQFADSPEAQGIMAGFEAELVFTGLGGEGEYDEDPEPDYDADERCYSIDDVINFFSNDEYGYATYDSDLDELQDGLDQKYMEWSDEKMYEAFRDEQEDLIRKIWLDERPMSERVHDYLVEGMDMDDREADRIQAVGEEAPKFDTSAEADAYIKQNPDYKLYIEAVEGAEDILEEDVEASIKKEDGYYDSAIDEFRENFYVDDNSGFFSDVGLRWMSDVANEFRLMWPVITYTGQSSEGGWSQDNAERLADDLHEKLGIRTKVAGGYHTATRDDKTWIFEPDTSLDSDDSDNMAVEIISPPMPLEQCLPMMENFFAWAEENGAYANSSTGFHMGVSLPHRGGAVDYVKLALFLGDEHVLKEFGRSSNHFCEAAIKKIRNRVKGNKEAVGNAMELMRNNLIELAQKALEINNHGFGKYTSINPKGGNDSTRPDKERGAKYIEFRSAGNSNYFEDIDKLKNTLLRYAKAMTVAANPAAERKEYYKKLYKLISPPEGDPALDLFSRFAAGEISSADLKKSWANKQLEAEPTGNWKLWDANGKPVAGQEYNGYTKSEAWERAHKKISPGGSIEGFKKEYTLRPMQSQTGDWEVYDVNTGETLETLHGYPTRGAAADAVYDKYAAQGRGFNLRPADPDAPEPELTKRERLAKNIKQAPPEEIKNWKIYDKETGEVHYEQEGRKSSLVQIMRKFERDNKLPQGRLAIEEIPKDPNKQKQDWDVVYKPTGRVIDTILRVDRDAAQKLLAQVAVLHDFANTDDLEIRPQQAEQPKPAQATTPDGVPIWEIFERETGHVVHKFDADTKEDAWEYTKNWLAGMNAEQPNLFSMRPKMNAGTPVKDIAPDIAQNFAQPADATEVPRDWEYVDRITGRVVDTVSNASYSQATTVQADVERRYPNADIYLRSVPTDASAERARNRANNNGVQDTDVDVAQNFATPPRGFTTTRPAVGDYYEVKSGDRIYGYVSTQAATDTTRSMPIEVKSYINQLTGRDDAQLVYRSGDPVQARAQNGVPMWEVYERDSGHVIHTFVDHTQQAAWEQARSYLRSIGAEDPSLFSCRPKMEA
jgi:Putative amidoligase enzyme